MRGGRRTALGRPRAPARQRTRRKAEYAAGLRVLRRHHGRTRQTISSALLRSRLPHARRSRPMNPLAQPSHFNVDRRSPRCADKDADEIAVLREAIDLTAEAAQRSLSPPRNRDARGRTWPRSSATPSTDARPRTRSCRPRSGRTRPTSICGATSRPLRPATSSSSRRGLDPQLYVGHQPDHPRKRTVLEGAARDLRLVLEAENHGCRGLVPGVTFKAVQTRSRRPHGRAGEARLGHRRQEPLAERLYIQHGFGHGIGLDVHDVWSWHSPRLIRSRSTPGMVVTMEPDFISPKRASSHPGASRQGRGRRARGLPEKPHRSIRSMSGWASVSRTMS